MGRYDRNRSKKSNNSTLIIAISISLTIGVIGTYYVMRNYKNLKTFVSQEIKLTRPDETSHTELFIDNSSNPIENESELTSIVPEARITAVSQPQNHHPDLPDLLSSDVVIRNALSSLSPEFMPWLNTDQLIRRYVVIINDFSQGLRIAKHMSFLRFDEPFAVEQGENGLQIAPKSYLRYVPLVQAVNVIDTKSALDLYKKFRPLLIQVFAEFGYPKDIDLESIVKKAASEILAAPLVEGPVSVVRPSMYYKLADPTMESLSPVQKQMIRMGGENMRIFQNKCREFLVELGKANFD